MADEAGARVSLGRVRLSAASSESQVLLAESPGVAHLSPDSTLGHGQQLPNMVSVVVDPFAKELVDAERANGRMKTDAGEVVGSQAAEKSDAVGPESREFGDEFGSGAELIVPRLCDGGRIPGLE